MKLHITHHADPELMGLLRGINRKLHYISGRLPQMATDAQVSSLKSHVEALISAYQQAMAALAEANKPPPAPVADPVLDDLDAKVQAALAPPTS